jgi:Protein of unknown function (DUF1524)
MVLEALEDSYRSPKTEEAHCRRGELSIEHVMPQGWLQHWAESVADDPAAVQERNHRVQTLGNLTLLTNRLNPVVSNNPWLAPASNPSIEGKREALGGHSVLLLNKQLVDEHPGGWNDQDIDERTARLARQIARIWRRP